MSTEKMLLGDNKAEMSNQVKYEILGGELNWTARASDKDY